MTKTYTMKEAAEMIGRTVQSIRQWEQDGLITPQRDDRGWRVFTDEDIKIMEDIKAQKRDLGKGWRKYV